MQAEAISPLLGRSAAQTRSAVAMGFASCAVTGAMYALVGRSLRQYAWASLTAIVSAVPNFSTVLLPVVVDPQIYEGACPRDSCDA